MQPVAAHRLAMKEFDRRVRRMGIDQMTNPTPCTEWNVRDLLNHLVSEQFWAPWLLDGATPDQVGDRFDGDQLGDDPQAAWAEASTAARAAWDNAEISGRVHVTGGTIPTEDYCWQMTMDLAVHAWDLANGIGADTRLDPKLVEAVYTVFEPHVDEMQGLGIFARPQPVAADADTQSKLLAMLGRKP